MKFAYLILAHNNFHVLEKLIGMLDDSRNDIYIHFDRKLKHIPEVKTNTSKLFILPDRIDVRWGTISQIKALYKLYHKAYSNDKYDFFFVISGTHLPLKSQDYIHNYFLKYQGNTVIRKWLFYEGEVDFKLRRYHLGINNFQSTNRIIKAIVQKSWSISMFIQKQLRVKTHRNEVYVKADEWAVISSDHIKYLIENEADILKKYRNTFCCDEFYLASELLKFDEMHIIDDPNLLFMHFEKDRPSVLDKKEYSELLTSPYIFARKFSDYSI